MYNDKNMDNKLWVGRTHCVRKDGTLRSLLKPPPWNEGGLCDYRGPWPRVRYTPPGTSVLGPSDTRSLTGT